MTLITFVVTSEYVVLASDRRQTTFVGGVPTKFEDVALKTFLLRGQLLMGYTGVAVLDGKPMEQWVAELLSGVRPNDIPATLRDAMQDHFARHPEAAKMPHHFRLAGYAYKPDRSPPTWPIGYEVGNCLWEARGDRVQVTHVSSQFRVVANVFGNQQQVVGAVGSPYSLRSLRVLEGKVRTARRANALDPTLVFGPVVDFMRGTAKRSAGMVGETLLLTCLPRSVVPLNVPRWSVPLALTGIGSAKTEPFAMMLNEGSSDLTTYLPAMIYPDFQVMGMTLTAERLAGAPDDVQPPLGEDLTSDRDRPRHDRPTGT